MGMSALGIHARMGAVLYSRPGLSAIQLMLTVMQMHNS